MKQLFLKSLLWTIQTTTKGIASTIRVINTRPAQLFWTPAFFYTGFQALSAGGWNIALGLLLAGMAGLSVRKLLTRSAPTEAADGIYTSDGRHLDEVTEARDQAVTELSAEAQAVVDRIKERTVRLIPNDPPATIKVKAPRKPRATKIIEVDGVPTIVPARPRKPKGGDQ